ncbi:MAG: energy transducer TonB, partial [Acidobacteriia bacterium]|nr:energy transducer TonB [Terriglobia bacterium]
MVKLRCKAGLSILAFCLAVGGMVVGPDALPGTQTERKASDVSPSKEAAPPQTTPVAVRIEKSPTPTAISAETTAPPVPIYKPEPPYSDEARRQHLEGTISLKILIDTQGNVTEAQETSKPLG